MKIKHHYLLQMQYLGFRYHGWQKQTNAKTVQEMFERTLCFVLEHDRFKTLGAGRTDAMVSTNDYACELFLEDEIDCEGFGKSLNNNLPQDIKILSIRKVNPNFRIINDAKTKRYIYLFSFGEKFHPFCAPLMTNVLDELNIELMIEGAKLFEGEHFFKNYLYKPKDNSLLRRTVNLSRIRENDLYTANFFPEMSYIFEVEGSGFGRHQIRLMIGMLIDLGRGLVSLDDIKRSLKEGEDVRVNNLAPSSGLILEELSF